MMEDEKEGGRAYGHWWWALASGAQLGLGVSSYRRGYAGDSRLMPLKAFVVASLFVGAAASTAVSVLKASGIHKIHRSANSAADNLGELATSQFPPVLGSITLSYLP